MDMSNILNKTSNIQNKVETLYENYNSRKKVLPEGCLVEFFEKSVIENRDKIAVCNGEKTITYGELNVEANKMARYLLEKGVQPNDFVLIQTGRNIETIIGLIAILKAGAAYIPVDENYPLARQDYIKNNSKSKYVIGKEDFSEYKKFNSETDNLNLNYSIDSLAYVIYTSGSTGNPKGVAITNRSVMNTIQDMLDKFKFGQEDKLIGISSYSFDLSVFDIFGALLSGASLHQVADARDIKKLEQIVTEDKITVWNSVPVLMELYVNRLSEDYVNHEMKCVLLSGDWIPVSLPEKIHRFFPNAKVVSLGGATEAAIWSIYYDIAKVNPEWKSIPYGWPLANQSMYILNYNQQVCPIGTQGEIYIGGKGVAKCYLNDVQKTQESFIEHETYGRLYKTGDFGIMHKEGYIEFCGRKDDQVKVNGFRIEIGEIEACLCQDYAVKQAVVVIQKKKDMTQIVAFIVPKGRMRSESYFKSIAMRSLPDYMVPAQFIQINEIPLSVNGKVDRKKLLESLKQDKKQSSYEPPVTETEKRLAAIIEGVLNNGQKIGRFDNFYAMSINSIMMMEIINKMQDEFHFKINFRDFIKVNNLMQLGEYADKVMQERGPDVSDAFTSEANKAQPEASKELKNAYEMFSLSKNMYPDHIAFEAEKLSYGQAEEKINEYTEQIKSYPVTRGSNIAILYTSTADTALAFLAVRKFGANPVVLGESLSVDDIKVARKENECALYFDKGLFYYEHMDVSSKFKEESFYSCYEKSKTGIVTSEKVLEDELFRYVSDSLAENHISDTESIVVSDSKGLHQLWKDIMTILSAGVAVRFAKEIVREQKENVGALLFWSPALQWKIAGDTLYIGDKYYKELPQSLFPELYFITQDGIEKNELEKFLSTYVSDSEVLNIVKVLTKNHILTDEILPIDDVFMAQGKLMQHKYGDNLIYDVNAYHKFKTEKLTRSTYSGEAIPLNAISYPLPFETRHSVRNFIKDKKIPFRILAQWISSLRQYRSGAEVRYNYASAGGFYPIDIYLNVKDERVEGLAGGLYYYNPVENSILNISKEGLTTDTYFYTNRDIFDSSAVSVLFVYNASVSMPRYQYMGYYYACIDCGILVSTLTEAGEILNLGSCSIGDFNFKKAADILNLGKNEALLHIVEFGLKQSESETSFYQKVDKESNLK